MKKNKINIPILAIIITFLVTSIFNHIDDRGLDNLVMGAFKLGYIKGSINVLTNNIYIDSIYKQDSIFIHNLLFNK